MKHICDGHEYAATQDGDFLRLTNNYGTRVAQATVSPCGEYWHFETADHAIGDSYHENALEGFTIEQQLVRWYAGLCQ